MTEYKDMLRLATRRKNALTGNTGTWGIVAQFEPSDIDEAVAVGERIVALDPSSQWRIETVGGLPVPVATDKPDVDPQAFVPRAEYDALQQRLNQLRKAVLACAEAANASFETRQAP